MLAKILNNFPQDELLTFIPESSVKFAIELDNLCEDISKIDCSYSTGKLSKVVASIKGVDFLFDESLRKRLIEGIPPSLFVDIFSEFDLESDLVTPKYYDAAIDWADENTQEFSKKLGLEEVYANHIGKNQTFEGIKRIEPFYTLYPYQIDISKKTISSLNEGHSRVLIHLPTGSGKTRTAMNIVSEHLRSSSNNLVLWLADREELCTQAYSEFLKAWQSLGNYSTSAYGFYSNSDESLSGIDSGLVVAGLHKFLNLRKSNSRQLQILYKELAEKVTMVIFDEAHKAVAPKFQEVVNDFINSENFHASLIGLTATPGRSYSEQGLSDEDAKLASFFENNKVSMKMKGYLSPIDYLVEKGYLAKAYFKSLNYDHSKISAYELRDAGGAATMAALANNVERNRRIISTILDECSNGSQIIVFACTVEHSINLAIALAYNGIKAASITSNTDTSESRRIKIEQYKANKLQVLVNFNVLTAGFDAPRTNVTVIAKPMSSLVQYLQMAGRAMRGYMSGGNKECTIYTVMDNIPEFQNVSIAFDYWNTMWTEKE